MIFVTNLEEKQFILLKKKKETKKQWTFEWLLEMPIHLVRFVLTWQRQVLTIANHIVIGLPAALTVVVQAVLIAAEIVRAVVAFGAFSVLQIRIDLNLSEKERTSVNSVDFSSFFFKLNIFEFKECTHCFFEFRTWIMNLQVCFDGDKLWFDRLDVTRSISERHSSRAYWVLILVRIQPSMNHLTEDFIHDLCKTNRIQHTMQSSHKYRCLGIDLSWQSTRLILWHIAGVLLIPWYDLNLLGLTSLVARVIVEVVVVVVAIVIISWRNEYGIEIVFASVLDLFAAISKHALNCWLMLEYDIDIARRASFLDLTNIGDTWMLLVLARYFKLDWAILLEQLDQVLLVHVPWETAKEDLAWVDGVLRVGLWWQATSPGVLVLVVALVVGGSLVAGVGEVRVDDWPTGCWWGRLWRVQVVQQIISLSEEDIRVVVVVQFSVWVEPIEQREKSLKVFTA